MIIIVGCRLRVPVRERGLCAAVRGRGYHLRRPHARGHRLHGFQARRQAAPTVSSPFSSVCYRGAVCGMCVCGVCVCLTHDYLRRERDASIPLIPGYDGADQSTETLSREAKRIGTHMPPLHPQPTLLSACAGACSSVGACRLPCAPQGQRRRRRQGHACRQGSLPTRRRHRLGFAALAIERANVR